MDIHVDLGQDVKAGALLATLESSELGLAQSAYLKSAARFSVSERAFTRAKSLLGEKVIGQADYQRREGEWITAQADMQEAYDRLRLLGMKEPEIRRLAQDKTIRSTVSVQAPFDGRILARNIVRGEVVDATDKLFALADLTEVWVVANVPEKDVASIHKDQAVEVRVIAYPERNVSGTNYLCGRCPGCLDPHPAGPGVCSESGYPAQARNVCLGPGLVRAGGGCTAGSIGGRSAGRRPARRICPNDPRSVPTATDHIGGRERRGGSDPWRPSGRRGHRHQRVL
jgi:hypothetical protein